MATFDELFSKARDVANAAGKKTGELMELSKLKLQTVSINSEIQKGYEKLGTIVYRMQKSGYADQSLIDTCVGEIDEAVAKLEELNQKISELKKVVRCTHCGQMNPVEAMFCSKCGSRLPEQPPQSGEKAKAWEPEEDAGAAEQEAPKD